MNKKNRYFVSVVVGDKCVSLFYSEDLCETHVCRALFKGCEIIVFDLEGMGFVPHEVIEEIERKTKRSIREEVMPQHVVCVETKEIFRSLSDCSSLIGVTSASLASAIYSLATVNGKHYLFESDLEGNT